MNLKSFLIFITPITSILIYIILRLIIISFSFGRIFVLLSFGALPILFGILLIFYILARHPLGMIFDSLIMLLLSLSLIYIVYLTRFSAMIIPFVISIVQIVFSILNISYAIKNFREITYKLREGKKRRRMDRKLKRQNKNNIDSSGLEEINARQKENERIEFEYNIKLQLYALFAIFLCISGFGFGIFYFPYQNYEKEFVISDYEAQSYELVLYYSNKADINETFAKIMSEANVSCVSFPMKQAEFAEGSVEEITAAYAVRNLTNYGIKVEVWPLFNPDEGFYPSISEIDRFPELYESFKNWTIRNSLNVDYILWDIETFGETPDTAQYNDLSEPFKTLALGAVYASKISETKKIWKDANEAIISLANQARLDGFEIRTTTHTIIWDVFDRDDDLQMSLGIPAWSSKDAYEYISMMSYRGCEWGGNSSSTWVYEHVHASDMTQQGKIAICLGCINYNPYPDIESVVHDVRLALAAGADAVRLFQGVSWVYGVGADPSKEITGNIAHGFNSTETEGLLQMLEECRKGGIVKYRPEFDIDLTIIGYILADIVLDLV
ncbi:MAG: hypothetical protein ACTSRZ_10340 [Promethearchaeota archaeon]